MCRHENTGEIKRAEFVPYMEFGGINDDIRGIPGKKPVREIKVAYTVIDLREANNASINSWSASETINIDAAEREVDAMILGLRAKVDAGKREGQLTPPAPPRGN